MCLEGGSSGMMANLVEEESAVQSEYDQLCIEVGNFLLLRPRPPFRRGCSRHCELAAYLWDCVLLEDVMSHIWMSHVFLHELPWDDPGS